MQFIHVIERSDLLKENYFDEPREVNFWLNAELIKSVFNSDGKCYIRTKHALYLVDGFCSDASQLFTEEFGF